MVCEPSIAHSIAFVVGMLAAVNLDDEPSLTANETDDIWSNRFLPNKFESVQRSQAKVLPH